MKAWPLHPDPGPSRRIFLSPPGGQIPFPPAGPRNPALPRSRCWLGPPHPATRLPVPPPAPPRTHAQKWLLLERAAGSSAVLPFYFSWDTQGDVGTATGVVRGSPHLPSPAAGERGEAQAPWSWVGPATVVPGPGGLRAQGRAPGRVGRAPRRGSGFFIKSHEA